MSISYVHSPEIKPKKSSGSFKKQKGKDTLEEEIHRSDSDSEDESPTGEEQGTDNLSGSESPRTSALRAMGGVAAQGVIDYMNKQSDEEKQHPSFEPPQDSLTTISEESELESSLPKPKQQQPPTMTAAPTITVTQVRDIISFSDMLTYSFNLGNFFLVFDFEPTEMQRLQLFWVFPCERTTCI